MILAPTVDRHIQSAFKIAFKSHSKYNIITHAYLNNCTIDQFEKCDKICTTKK